MSEVKTLLEVIDARIRVRQMERDKHLSLKNLHPASYSPARYHELECQISELLLFRTDILDALRRESATAARSN